MESPPKCPKQHVTFSTATSGNRSIRWNNTWPSSNEPRGCSKHHHTFLAIQMTSKITSLATMMLCRPQMPWLEPIGLLLERRVDPLDLSCLAAGWVNITSHLKSWRLFVPIQRKNDLLRVVFFYHTGAAHKAPPGLMFKVWYSMLLNPTSVMMSWSSPNLKSIGTPLRFSWGTKGCGAHPW